MTEPTKNPMLMRELLRLEKQRLLRDTEHRHRMAKWSQRVHDAIWVTIAALMLTILLMALGYQPWPM